MRRLLTAVLVLTCLAAGLALPASGRAAAQTKVAIIVGPVGSLTPTYLHLAETAAASAERHGATVARAYSPHATPANVLAAVADAHVVVYFGHGYGHPSPYGGLDTRRQNGWGLQGPRARGTHADGVNGYLQYLGEDWVVANARPAPGFVMIYSNTCYAPGASEGGHAPATPSVAADRVAYYSRKVFAMGGSAYYATDFDRGAADLIERLLGDRHRPYGEVFAADGRFVPGALSTQAHRFSAGQQIWLHRTKYTDGPSNYWYAFAGNPSATPARSWDPVPPTAELAAPAPGTVDVEPWTGIELRLSEPVTGVGPETVRLMDATGDPVPADVVHDAGAGSVRITPHADLELSARYTVDIGTGIADQARNPLEPVSWSFVTRLDADPLVTPVPVVLEAGIHRLILLGADGSVTDERPVEVTEPRWLVASSRARLPGERGSWLALSGDPFDGWWVAESPRAHTVGRAEEVALARTDMALHASRDYAIALLGEEGIEVVDEVTVREERVISVDRRMVVDGRTYLRVVGGLSPHEGRWIAVASELAPDAAESRLLGRRERPLPAELRLDLRRHVAHRIDSAGRVVAREVVAGGTGVTFATQQTISVSGTRMFVVSGGPLDGWAFVDRPGVTVVGAEARDPS